MLGGWYTPSYMGTTFALEYACPNPSWVLTAIPLSRPLIILQIQLEKRVITYIRKLHLWVAIKIVYITNMKEANNIHLQWAANSVARGTRFWPGIKQVWALHWIAHHSMKGAIRFRFHAWAQMICSPYSRLWLHGIASEWPCHGYEHPAVI